MRFVIVTGVSGAGKTAALKMLEDMGYFCVDNLPIQLLEKFASLLPEMQSENVRNVALGIDARSGSALDELEVVLDRMKQKTIVHMMVTGIHFHWTEEIMDGFTTSICLTSVELKFRKMDLHGMSLQMHVKH